MQKPAVVDRIDRMDLLSSATKIARDDVLTGVSAACASPTPELMSIGSAPTAESRANSPELEVALALTAMESCSTTSEEGKVVGFNEDCAATKRTESPIVTVTQDVMDGATMGESAEVVTTVSSVAASTSSSAVTNTSSTLALAVSTTNIAGEDPAKPSQDPPGRYEL